MRVWRGWSENIEPYEGVCECMCAVGRFKSTEPCEVYVGICGCTCVVQWFNYNEPYYGVCECMCGLGVVQVY